MASPSLTRRILRDPLIHFLVIGLCFIGFDLVAEKTRDEAIIVTDPQLAIWLQYRNKAFSPDAAQALIARMPAAAKQQLIDDYAAEEALYRRALALGLDRNDAVIRQRLVQKMDYALLGLSDVDAPPSDQALRAYFNDHKARYTVPPSVTLTHLYFADGPRARAAAQKALTDIQAGRDAPPGDRFLYHRNYVEAQATLIADHLGPALAALAFDDATPLQEWLGPVRSPYGWHLVRVRTREGARQPDFNEVEAQVAADFQRDRKTDARRRATRALTDQYRIRIEE